MCNTQVDQTRVFENELHHRMEQLLQASISLHMKTILNLIESDPHQWSSRPCTTCRTVSNLIGRPFGCMNKS